MRTVRIIATNLPFTTISQVLLAEPIFRPHVQTWWSLSIKKGVVGKGSENVFAYLREDTTRGEGFGALGHLEKWCLSADLVYRVV